MARIRLIVLAVLAVFCMSAVAAAAAASASEGEFVKAGTTKALEKNKFTGTSATTRLVTASGSSIVCTSSTAHGILTSTTGGELTVLFKGCTAGGLSCKGGKDAGGEPKAGEIFVLLGLLVKRRSSVLRLTLLTIHTPGTLTAGELEIVCSGVKIKVKGSFLTSNSTETKKSFTKSVLEAKQSKGIQEPSEYENEKGEKVKVEGLKASFEGGEFEAAGQEGSETENLEEGAEYL